VNEVGMVVQSMQEKECVPGAGAATMADGSWQMAVGRWQLAVAMAMAASRHTQLIG